MTKIFAGMVTAIMLTFASFAPAQANMAGLAQSKALSAEQDNLVEKTGRRGRRRAVGAAIALGIIGAAAIAASRSSRADHYYDRRDEWYHRCRKWRRRCNRGNDRACWKFDRRC